MSDLGQLLEDLVRDGTIMSIATNARAQFGREGRRYIGAELLPELTVEENAFREERIRYRTILANAGTRYSPAQKRGGALIGSFLVELGEHDIAAEFTSREYDTLLRHIRSGSNMTAMASLVDFVDTVINGGLIERNEKDRWDAIVTAQVTREGDNNYQEIVTYPDPANHRVAPGAAWSTDTTEIMEDIFAQADLLASKGYTVNRIITSRDVISIMAGNDTIKTRTGYAVVNPSGQIQSAVGRATQAAINQLFLQDGLPAPELYDLQYRTMTGTEYFLPRDVFVMVATTGRDASLDLGDSTAVEIVQNTLGYHAIGRPAGASAPGRMFHGQAFTNKPPRIEWEGWQTSLPVITEPEAITVINSIT